MSIDHLRTRYRSAFLLAAAVVPLLLALVLSAFKDSISNATAVLVLVLFVVAVAASGDRLAGVLAALSSGIWFDYFLTEPFHRFAMSDPNDIEDAALLVLVGTGVTELALWGRRQQGRASRRAGYLDGVLQTADIATRKGSAEEDVIGTVAGQIQEVLLIDRCRYVANAEPGPQTPRLNHDGTVTRRGAPVNVERDGLPVDDEIALPVGSGGVSRGHYLLTAATHIVRPSLEQRRVAVLLADQVGVFLTERGSVRSEGSHTQSRSPGAG